MTRIDFYALQKPARGDRFTLACRLAEKIFQQQRQLFIYTDSEEEAHHLDRLLWTFREGSFLPHGRVGQANVAITPILVGARNQNPPEEQRDVMINLSTEVPFFFNRFERVAEPLDNAPGIREAARIRFRFYRDREYALHFHPIER